jgi:hypothetical protein
MPGRLLRPTIVLLLGLTLAGAGWQIFRLDRGLDVRSAADAATARVLARCREAMFDLRATERAYTEPDQDLRFWRGRGAGDLEALNACADAIDARASQAPARRAASARLRAAVVAVRRIDGRIADLAGTNLRDHAHDLLYGDAINASVTLERELAATEAALALPSETDSAAAIRGQQATAALLAAAAALFAALALLRWPRQVVADAAEPRVTGDRAADAEPAETMPRVGERAASPAALQAAADVCGALARVQQPLELAGLVERLHGVLDSRGTIVWIYDEAADALRPGLSAGYPPTALGRMGSIPLSSDTPVAHAFTRGEARTVKGTAEAPGALVVPIVAPGGVAGVVTIELPPGNDRQPATLALTRIFAAQLAGLLSVSVRPANTTGPEIVMPAVVAKVAEGARERTVAAGSSRYSDLS